MDISGITVRSFIASASVVGENSCNHYLYGPVCFMSDCISGHHSAFY
jgi:hypothetical protein